MEKEIEPVESLVYNNIRSTLISAKQKVYSVINFTMMEAYWEIGRQIMEAQDNNPRAEYGAQLLKYLSEKLTGEFGKGFDESSLRRMLVLSGFPNSCHTVARIELVTLPPADENQ